VGPGECGGAGALGADPDSITLVVARDTLGVLQAGADSVNCAAIGSVVIEPWGRAPELGLTESRRLAFAAARSGALTLALRIAVSNFRSEKKDHEFSDGLKLVPCRTISRPTGRSLPHVEKERSSCPAATRLSQLH
jgi:hypothetical protein